MELQQTITKPFILFGGEKNGDMLGGMNDFVAQYDSIAEAQECTKEYGYGWADVALLHDGKLTRVATIDVDTGQWDIFEPALIAEAENLLAEFEAAAGLLAKANAETDLEPHFGRIYLAWNNTCCKSNCSVCGEDFDPHWGYEFFHFISRGVVCDACAQKYAPIMFALRSLLRVVSYEGIASQGREIFDAIRELVKAVRTENQWVSEKTGGNGL